MKTLLMLIFALLSIFEAKAQKSIDFIDLENTSLEDLMKLSQTTDRLILIYFTSDGCSPCLKMENQVFTDTTVHQFFNNNFICAKSHIRFIGNSMRPKDYNSLNKTQLRIREMFDIQGNPSFVVINFKGEIVHKSRYGYKDKLQMVRFGEAALGDSQSFVVLKERIQNGDYSFHTVNLYLSCLHPASYYADDFFKCEVQQVLDHYFANQIIKDFSSENNWYIIKNHVDNPKSEPFEYLLNNQEEFFEKYGREDVNKRIFHVLRTYAFTGNRGSKRYKLANEEIKTLTYPQALALVEYYSLMENANQDDLNSYVQDYNKVFGEYNYIFAYEVNDISWKVYEVFKSQSSAVSGQTLETVSNWMKSLTSLADVIEYYDTYAHILYIQGNRESAIREQEKAIRTAELNNASAKRIDNLKAELLKMQ
jgi:thioredoxin-related protein